MKSLLLALAITTLSLYKVQIAKAQPSCNLEKNRKEAIEAVLCGQAAQEQEYRFSGKDCVRNSLRKRLGDSAIQVAMFRACGDLIFPQKMEIATISTVKFMQTLSICTQERIDVRSIFDQEIARITKEAPSCNSQHRNLLESRRPYFEKMIDAVNNQNIDQIVYDRLGIVVDSNGNISSR
jgi:hypothetical protein